MSTIFSKIISGDIPCHRLAEDERFLSFLDLRPVSPGHALVIPKKEVDYIFDLEDQLLGDIMIFAKPIAKALELVVPCKKVGVMVAGLEVPHAHVHLIPFSDIHDLAFSKATPAVSKDLADLAGRIRAKME